MQYPSKLFQQIIFNMKPKVQRSVNQLRSVISFTQTFQSSQQEKQQKFMLDKSIARGITQNKSSIIVEQHTGRCELAEEKTDQSEEADRFLLDYRSKYDKVKTQSWIVEQNILKQKEELTRLKEEKDLLWNRRQQLDRNQTKMENHLFNIQYQMDELLLSHDSGKSMEDRLKNDILFYKKRIFDCNLQLMKKKSERRRFDTQSNRQNKLSLRCKTLLTSVQSTLNSNQIQRNGQLQVAKSVLSSKKQHQIKQKQRQYLLQKSLQAAMNDKMPSEKQLDNLKSANKLLKKILHCKMQNLMKKYNQISNAFNKIKINTTVKNADQFVQKFLHKNEIYGALLQSISKLQPRLQDLKQQEKKLNEKNNELHHQNDEISQQLRNSMNKNDENGKDHISQLNNRILGINKYRNSLTNWALGVVSMFRAAPRTQIRQRYDYLGNLLGDTLRSILKYLQQNSQKQRQKSISQQAFQKQLSVSKTGPKQLLSRNIRIKTLGNEQTLNQEDDVEYDLISEKDYLHHTRKAVKKLRYAKTKGLVKI